MTTQRGELLVYLGLGQSLLALVPRGRPLPVRATALDPQRALVFAADGSPRMGANPLEPLAAERMAALHPHQSHPLAGALTEATRAILPLLGPQDAVLTVNLARRGARIEDFGAEATTASHANVAAVLRRAGELAQARGLRLGRMVVSWVQGQANRNAGLGVYQAALEALFADLAALHHAQTGQSDGLLMCLTQNTATSPGHRRCIGAEQWRAVQASGGRMVIAGPEYMLERSDGLHLTAQSAAYLGALHGRAIAAALQGRAEPPLHIAQALRHGTEITVQFAGGQGDLVQDSGVGDQRIGMRPLPHWGFSWTQRGGTPVSIESLQVTGPRQITLRLSGDPGPKAVGVLHLGLPPTRGLPEGFVGGDPATAKGGGSQLRTAGDGAAVYGLALHDWAVQQSIPLARPETGGASPV